MLFIPTLMFDGSLSLQYLLYFDKCTSLLYQGMMKMTSSYKDNVCLILPPNFNICELEKEPILIMGIRYV